MTDKLLVNAVLISSLFFALPVLFLTQNAYWFIATLYVTMLCGLLCIRFAPFRNLLRSILLLVMKRP